MDEAPRTSCSNCEASMDSNQLICPSCGMPRGSQSKSDGYRLIIAIAASIAIILVWQWWRGAT